jgi:5-oxoprolinase (ATP-hydrolysing) subunit A
VRQLDLNADVGEGDRAADEALIPLVSSANIACGLHAGDPKTMRATLLLAASHGVAVGAHPGFSDREGFGRREVHLGPDSISDLMLYQLGALDAIARAEGISLRHVKPHGALYNQAETDGGLARAIIAAIRRFDPGLRLVGRAGSAMQRAAEDSGHAFTPEAFADRRYQADGSLLPRARPGAVLSDPEDVVRQVTRLVTQGEVLAGDGSRVPVAFESLCLHGDTPGSGGLAVRIRQDLGRLGVSVCAPTFPGIDIRRY